MYSGSDHVDCPYCGYPNDMSDIYEALDEDNNCDWECGDCGEEFAIYVEFSPTYYASEIVYAHCECCEKETRDIRSKKNVAPFPVELGDLKVCLHCYHRHMRKEYNEAGRCI